MDDCDGLEGAASPPQLVLQPAARSGGDGGGGKDDAEIMRILVSTDNHVGFLERDPVRGEDSFLAFEEVLWRAQEKGVDLVLLAGDLFHESRPSRHTLYKTMAILRKYTMGDKPVRVQVVSDQSIHFGKSMWGPDEGPRGRAIRQAPAQPPPGKAGGGAKGSKGAGAEAGGGGRGKPAPPAPAPLPAEDAALLPSFLHAPPPSAFFNRVNWEDPHYNVELPVFAIHGNHDDPACEGPGEEILASLDLLQVSNLINYIGKSESADEVYVNPVCILKGSTKLSLYGLGNVRDERFQRLLMENRVKFRRPTEEPDSWFSIFMIHQNRDNRAFRGRVGNTAAEDCLPKFLDLVIWGHEHECFTEVSRSRNPGSNTFIMQPGSTVATSLSDGESKEKNVFLLEVRGFQFRAQPIPLRCVRPFVIDDCSLASVPGLADAPDMSARLTQVLQDKVSALIQRVAQQVAARPPELRPPAWMCAQPLVRLKVEHTGFPTLPAQRFGAVFADRVANPADILLFWRRPAARVSKAQKAAAAGLDSGEIIPMGEDAALAAAAPSNAVSLEDVLQQQLRGTASALKVLDGEDMQAAIRKFIEGDPHAIESAVDAKLKAQQRLSKAARATSAAEMDAVFKRLRDEARGGAASEEEEEEAAGAGGAAGAATGRRARAAAAFSDDDVGGQAEAQEPPAKRARGAAASGRGSKAASGAKGRRRAASLSSSEEEDGASSADGGSDSEEFKDPRDDGDDAESLFDDEEDEEEDSGRGKGKGAKRGAGAAPKSRAAGPAAKGRKAPAAAASASSSRKGAKAASPARKAPAAASRAKAAAQSASSEGDEEEEVAIVQPAPAAKRPPPPAGGNAAPGSRVLPWARK